MKILNLKEIEIEKQWKSIIPIVPIAKIELNDLIRILKKSLNK